MKGGTSYTDVSEGHSRKEEQQGPKPWALAGLRKMEKAGCRSIMGQGGEEIEEASRGHNPAGSGGRE